MQTNLRFRANGLWTILAFASTLGANSAAQASTYSAVFCDDYAAIDQQFDWDSNGYLESTNPSIEIWILCPVIGANSTTPGRGTVYVTDQNFNTDLWCDARVTNPSSGWRFISSRKTTVGSSPNAQALAPVHATGNSQSDVRFLFCGLPPVYSGVSSEIRGYTY